MEEKSQLLLLTDCQSTLFVLLTCCQIYIRPPDHHQLMNKAPRQKRAEIQRLTSISNLRTKQLSGSVGKRGHEEPDRIEHFDLELRPSKLHDLKVGEFISGGDSMVAGFLDAIAKVRQFKFHNDDDLYDRLSRRFSVVLLMLFTVVVSTKQYVGDPIACFAPAQFTGSHVEYANYICWISNTYYVPFESTLPARHDERPKHIAYYQWIPFILLLMSVLFYIPSVLWHALATKTGFDIANLVKTLHSMEQLNPDIRDRTLRYIAKHIDRALEIQREMGTGFFSQFKRLARRHCPVFIIGRAQGNYLTFVYLFVKLLYITNVVGQLFLLNLFMGSNYHGYGIEVLRNLLSGRECCRSARFPRVTMCDFEIRTMADHIHKHTIQCVLPVNLFNEKIFIFIWFWLVIVSILSSYGFIMCIWQQILPFNREHFLKKYLKIMNRITRETFDRKLFNTFSNKYLRHDGVLVLRLVAMNTNDVVMGEIMVALWDGFKRAQDTDGGIFV
ncbi:unnamed protein product [Rotaria sordida]|uniref:Innexin n=1 Tax=Rotaria sordida TaxID=392033 RepID=A0A818JQM4_9BILA|nr:unnamed protein product [Rotaria sordida]CAF3544934.1 unnamed protein product [Rotaria sordida]